MQKRVATNNYKWKILSNFLIFLKLIFADNIWYWHVHICYGGLISFNFYLIHGILFTQTMPSSVTKMEWDSPVMVFRPHMTMHITSQFRGYRYDRKCWVTRLESFYLWNIQKVLTYTDEDCLFKMNFISIYNEVIYQHAGFRKKNIDNFHWSHCSLCLWYRHV